MSRSLGSARHKATARLLITQRKAAGLTQQQVAERLRRRQSYVSDIESGDQRCDVAEFLAFADAIGFDPAEAMRALRQIPA